MKDYYAVLEVPRNATLEVIKAAYRRLCKLFHPDKNPGNAAAEARMKDINGAWEVLGDDEKRKFYDAAWGREAEAARQRTNAEQQQSGAAAWTNHAEWWAKNWGWVVGVFVLIAVLIVAVASTGQQKRRTRFA